MPRRKSRKSSKSRRRRKSRKKSPKIRRKSRKKSKKKGGSKQVRIKGYKNYSYINDVYILNKKPDNIKSLQIDDGDEKESESYDIDKICELDDYIKKEEPFYHLIIKTFYKSYINSSDMKVEKILNKIVKKPNFILNSLNLKKANKNGILYTDIDEAVNDIIAFFTELGITNIIVSDIIVSDINNYIRRFGHEFIGYEGYPPPIS